MSDVIQTLDEQVSALMRALAQGLAGQDGATASVPHVIAASNLIIDHVLRTRDAHISLALSTTAALPSDPVPPVAELPVEPVEPVETVSQVEPIDEAASAPAAEIADPAPSSDEPIVDEAPAS